ncbi:uncharacterized protein LOC128243638 [Mya arenaria]|uniref:uncharacterized protein LOC128243638 n=1 Tax=Mya arenaria TaxID=6604 RepID=UPI0022E00645|nr:uncharacterized protein LOC128243638 [Mya arenaria]
MPKVLYHHTDLESTLHILISGQINKSTDPKHARFGPGVYLTEINQYASVKEILINNYDDAASKKQMKKLIEKRGERTQVCIELKISSRLFKENVEECDTKRNVFLYKGDLILADMDDVSYHVRDDE